jgi:hypothetical protein
MYIVHESGVCLYDLDFNAIKMSNGKLNAATDPQLISGFFTAIITFGESTVNDMDKGCELNFISFKNHSFYFCRLNHFFIILETDAVETNLTKENIEDIMHQVVNIYQEYINKGVFDVDGCIYTPDENFENDIKNYIAKVMRKSLFKKIAA